MKKIVTGDTEYSTQLDDKTGQNINQQMNLSSPFYDKVSSDKQYISPSGLVDLLHVITI